MQADGFTGDLAVIHEDGYVQIADRSKDIIISGGENISSVEIQDVLYAHPDVADAAVVARPDEKWGETPCAFIELKPGSKVTEKEMNDFCRKRLAGFKRPRTYIFIDLPKTSTGKIQKFKLRERAKMLIQQSHLGGKSMLHIILWSHYSIARVKHTMWALSFLFL